MQNFVALILAGGGGSRLWPMSRDEKPKQMLPLVNKHSMFKVSVERLAPLFTPDRIYISTGSAYVDGLRAECPEIPEENFIPEPSRRNNAAAVALAITIIEKRHPDAIVAMLTADHHIGKIEHFRTVLETSAKLANEGKIVTLGITPTVASTGFGYIEQGEHLGTENSLDYYKSKRFTEKPDVVRASQFVASGKYSWNSGMFIWQASKAMAEFKRQQGEMYNLFIQLQATVDTPDYQQTLISIWEQTPKISIDYAIMEGAEDMVVIPVDIGWNDVGTWSSLYDVLPRDKFGNPMKDSEQDRIVLDANDTLLFSDKLTVAIGVDNIIVVETDDVLMVIHKDRAQEVKQIVNYLRDNNMEDYL
ncbi:MAG: sugar phosphate nucleotidyltransferase [Chloroflexota bacterium]